MARSPSSATCVLNPPCTHAVAAVFAAFGRLDVLVNNAAVFASAALESLSLDQWDAVFETNARGPFLVAREALPHLRTAQGRIINIGSLGASHAWAGHAHYCASKAALHMLTQAMAKAFAPEVSVNCVAPGWIEFPVLAEKFLSRAKIAGSRRRTIEREAARFAAKTPMGRNGDRRRRCPGCALLRHRPALHHRPNSGRRRRPGAHLTIRRSTARMLTPASSLASNQPASRTLAPVASSRFRLARLASWLGLRIRDRATNWNGSFSHRPFACGLLRPLGAIHGRSRIGLAQPSCRLLAGPLRHVIIGVLQVRRSPYRMMRIGRQKVNPVAIEQLIGKCLLQLAETSVERTRRHLHKASVPHPLAQHLRIAAAPADTAPDA